MTESHVDTPNTEERQNDALSATGTPGMSMQSTSYTSTTLHSTSHRDSAVHDQSPLQVPVSETLPTDMSDTTESDAEKHSVTGVCVCVCLYEYCSPWHLTFLFRYLKYEHGGPGKLKQAMFIPTMPVLHPSHVSNHKPRT